MSDVFSVITDPARVSFDIPAPVKLAIADAIIAFARLETTVEQLIWSLVGIPDHHGPKLTRMDTRAKFQLLEGLMISEIFIEKKRNPKDLWTMLRELTDERNMVIHGIWAMVDKTDPYIYSHKLKAPKGIIRSRHFPIELLQHMEKSCRVIEDSLIALCEKRPSSLPK